MIVGFDAWSPSSTAMHDYWKRFSEGLSLERFMAAVENHTQPLGPPNTTAAIRLATDELLQRLVPLSDVAAVAWQMVGRFQNHSTHDLALVTALYFLQARKVPLRTLETARRDARFLAQQWMMQGHASVDVVSRFEQALFEQFS